jgi:CheY-like chemotaxis protein
MPHRVHSKASNHPISSFPITRWRTANLASQRSRSYAFGAAIPAFLMSGDTAPERLREAQESGHHLLHKPVRPMRLRAMIDQMLKTPQSPA